MMKFSVSIYAEGDRETTLEEIVELADAVARLNGIASGVGSMGYGAQIVVEAENSDKAVDLAIDQFNKAVSRTELPVWPVSKAECIGEDDDYGDLDA
ncbi:MAG: hypothetical protein WCO64_05505 [Actinomycetes bacterium]